MNILFIPSCWRFLRWSKSIDPQVCGLYKAEYGLWNGFKACSTLCDVACPYANGKADRKRNWHVPIVALDHCYHSCRQMILGVETTGCRSETCLSLSDRRLGFLASSSVYVHL